MKTPQSQTSLPASLGDALLALSIRQPWAWLIANGHKDVENRTWRTRFRGRFLIHAGATMTRDDYVICARFISDMHTPCGLPAFDVLRDQCGGIVGDAQIVDCVTDSDSPWFIGDFGFVIRNARVLPFRACKGSLGFFIPPNAPASATGCQEGQQ